MRMWCDNYHCTDKSIYGISCDALMHSVHRKNTEYNMCRHFLSFNTFGHFKSFMIYQSLQGCFCGGQTPLLMQVYLRRTDTAIASLTVIAHFVRPSVT